jgi:hypothetical protein
MTFSDLIAWVMRFWVGEKSGHTAQLAADQAAEKEFVVDALATKAQIDDAVRGTSVTARRSELLRWSGPRPDDRSKG